MRVIDAKNVNEALHIGNNLLTLYGKKNESRAGNVHKIDGPVTTVYKNPLERVLFNVERNANPFFHFFESLWMLSGAEDVKVPSLFVNSIKNFSDDGKIFHGAYGKRWISSFGFDQINEIIKNLKRSPNCRRQVLQMWDAKLDLGEDKKDLPCNTHIYFSINDDNSLDMTVSNRSNDMIWGAYGANVVHFSYLQEYVAGMIGVGVGKYWQVSNNFHAYEGVFDENRSFDIYDKYDSLEIEPYDIFNGLELEDRGTLILAINEFIRLLRLDLDNDRFVNTFDSSRCKFITDVAIPLLFAHRSFKECEGKDKYTNSLKHISDCKATDWKLASREWILRKKKIYLERVG